MSMKHCIKKQCEPRVSKYVGLKLFVLSLNCGLDVYIMKSMADLKKKKTLKVLLYIHPVFRGCIET